MQHPNTNIVVTAVMIVAVVSGIISAFPNNQTNKYLSGIIASLHNKDFIQASGQYGGTSFVTVAVESYTLPTTYPTSPGRVAWETP